MENTQKEKQPIFEGPGCYRVVVSGYLNGRMAERVGFMRITERIVGDKEQRTTLEGVVRDQADLSGVLNTLYEMHLPLVSVEYLSRGGTKSH
jgi:hypothetical protein